MTDAPKAAAGWYAHEGGQRYWDGEQWLDIPAPAASEPITSAPAPRRRRSRKGIIIAIAAAVLVLGGGGVAWGVVASAQAEEARIVAAEEAAREAKEVEDAEAAAKAEQQRIDDQEAAERESRRVLVGEVEAAVMKMAGEHHTEGLLEDPPIETSCEPVAGGSTDNLDQRTAVLQCFVATEDNGDGTMWGQYYNATVNWDTGAYTYGYGKP